jgi:NAD(P)-dependent dehydrogenase (short-subunit alcohol dehydrogenase family)
MDLELTGKVALITGGSRGIGKAIALVLAEEGADVALCAREPRALEAAAAEIAGKTGRRVHAFPADVRDRAVVDRLVADVAAAFSRLDILVNNAGMPGGLAFGPLERVQDEVVLEDLDTKYMGALRCARAALPHMKRRGWGRIVNIGGTSGRFASNYSGGVRNVALVHFTRMLAHEVGREGITVNIVHPGATHTEGIDPLIEERARLKGLTLETWRERMLEDMAIGRMVEAREFAWVVAFVASPRAAAISGEVISASGGTGRAIFT